MRIAKSLLCAVLLTLSVTSLGRAAEPLRNADKTLVVWVAPANLDQGGGSALTIDDLKGRFDGIIFAERAPKRWMAGSNGYRRTQKDQAANAEETADANTLVQMAIVYRGREVTIYRNGQQYAQYTLESDPVVFGPDSIVMMGKRHLDTKDENRFAGAIDDARVYAAALDADVIAALKPNESSGPKPWAWWNFEDGKATDRMGAFGSTLLVGGASVNDGRLILDGKDGAMVAVQAGQITGWLARQANASDLDGAINASRQFRERLLSDPHRPGYHFVIPEGPGMPFDPNGAIFWKGRYHLFYIFQDSRGHNWGHVSSTDLLHWRHHPTGLVAGMFSGNCFINKDGRPTMCYHQVGQGNAMAVALDDELNEWKKLDSNPITPETKPGDPHHDKYNSWDPFGWVEGDTYYAIFGGKRPGIVKAPSLAGEWNYVGDLMANTVEGVAINEDVSCADLFPIGNRHMLLCISHTLGCRYYLGDWKNEQFHPTFHEKMSWVDNSYFAPESLLDDRGRRIMWAWIFDGTGFGTRMDYGWSGTMSLPRVLSLGDDGRLRMNAPEELDRLRYNGQKLENLTIEANKGMELKYITGDCIEIDLEMSGDGATRYGLKVRCSPGGEEQTLVYYDAETKKLSIDTRKSSIGDGPKSIEAGPLELKPGEPLKLRVYVDKSVVEVFANGRQAVMRRIYPTRKDSLGVVLYSEGGPSKVTTLEAWDMMPSNPQ